MANGAHRLRPMIGAALALTVALAVVIGFSWRAGLQVDARALARQSEYANRGFSELFEKIPRDQESVTVWDEAVTRAQQLDSDWLAENLGVWMSTYFGHSRAYVLNAADDPIYAMVDGQTVPAVQYEQIASAIAPQAELLRAGLRGGKGPTGGIEFTAVIEGHPSIVSLKPIMPSTGAVTVPIGAEHVHVAIQYLEGEVLTEISRRYNLRDLQLNSEILPNLPVMPIGGNVTPFAYLQWTANRPGSETVIDQLPLMIGAVLCVAGFLFFLFGRLRRSERHVAESDARASFLSDHDRLTGLPNRNQFVEATHVAVRQAEGSNLLVAVVTIDFDDFSAVNDAHGTSIGDQVIQAAADRMRANLKVGELIARVGGDEFAAVKTMSSSAELEEFIPRLIRAMSAPFLIDEVAVSDTVSMGIAIYPTDSGDAGKLIANADLALGRAESMGRGAVCLYDPTFDEVARQRRELSHEIEHGLNNGQFFLAYQVQKQVSDASIVGYEALLRWQHPRRGLVNPGEFIAVAEQSGHMVALGRWVMTTACSEFTNAGLEGRLAVNLSPYQLSDPGLIETVVDALLKAGMSPTRLELEVTETALIANNAHSLATLQQLQTMGISIALDDFGTGYSSLETVRSFSWDTIKLDRSFMSELESSDQSKAIMRALSALGQALGTPVLAEGVETQEQLDALIRKGCDHAQGFLLGRPLPIAELMVKLGKVRAA